MNKIWSNFFINIQQIIIPALIFFVAIMSFYILEEITPISQLTLHYSFYTLSIISFFVLLFFNQTKPIFFVLLLLLSSILINFLKRNGVIATSATYSNLCFLVPLNIAVFYFLPNIKMIKKTNIMVLLGVFVQISLLEYLYHKDITIVPKEFSFFLFAAIIFVLFIASNLKTSSLNFGLFFASLAFFGAIYYATSSTALSIFYVTAIFIIFVTLCFNIYLHFFFSELTGLKSRTAFMLEIKTLPLKYVVAIINIDDYSSLKNKFGNYKNNQLVIMVSSILKEMHSNIFQYSNSEFILLFNNLDKTEAFNEVEEMRRQIAKTDFIFKKYKLPVKITVSGVVAEKKRSDFSCMEVLERAHKVFSKTKDFNHNLISKA